MTGSEETPGKRCHFWNKRPDRLLPESYLVASFCSTECWRCWRSLNCRYFPCFHCLPWHNVITFIALSCRWATVADSQEGWDTFSRRMFCFWRFPISSRGGLGIQLAIHGITTHFKFLLYHWALKVNSFAWFMYGRILVPGILESFPIQPVLGPYRGSHLPEWVVIQFFSYRGRSVRIKELTPFAAILSPIIILVPSFHHDIRRR